MSRSRDIANLLGAGSVILDGAPSALDTLNELAAAIGDDANYATTVTNALSAKAPTASPTFTGTVILPSTTSIGDVSNTEISYLDGVTSGIQTQINGKAPTTSPTFTGNLTMSTGAPALFNDVGNQLGGRILSNFNTLYIQGGTSSSDTSAQISIARTATTTTAISQFNVYADTTIFSGKVVAPFVTNAQTASYTLVLADQGKLVEMNVATANNLTVPLNSSVAFPTGTKIDILQVGAGQTTVVATGGVTINASPGLKLSGQWSAASLIKRGTDTWVLIGNLSA